MVLYVDEAQTITTKNGPELECLLVGTGSEAMHDFEALLRIFGGHRTAELYLGEAASLRRLSPESKATWFNYCHEREPHRTQVPQLKMIKGGRNKTNA